MTVAGHIDKTHHAILPGKEEERSSAADKAALANPSAHPRELFDTGSGPTSRKVGLFTVLALLVTATLTFLMLMGLLPIAPSRTNTLAAAGVNGFLASILLYLIGREAASILRSRRKGRAASRLHVRIIGLFSLVAALPAVLVAVIAGITLDLGLDRWFELRTRTIVESSVNVARAYMNESTRVLMGNTLSMAANLDRNRQLYILDRRGFGNLFTIESRGRGFAHAALLRSDGSELVRADLDHEGDLPQVPVKALEVAQQGEPVPILPGNTNLVSAVIKLREIPDAYLYSVIEVQPAVIEALRQTEENSSQYNQLEANRLPVQIAFAILYLGVCLIVLLSAVWMGISVANRIVSPIRRLIFTADRVSDGNLDVRVDLKHTEGDLRSLGETFNQMLTDIQGQQGELVTAKEVMDQRARFTEAVLSGVSAGVIGLDQEGRVTIANPSAQALLDLGDLSPENPQLLAERSPELADVFKGAVSSGQTQYHDQITLLSEGRERTLNVQVTMEREGREEHAFVMTIDDITDLVSAQRNTAWADVARRIAHEIKNPLTPIQLAAERIRRRYGKLVEDDREVFDNCTDTIIRQVSDIGKMVDEFSAFARMPNPEMAFGDIGKVVRETVFMQKVGYPDVEFDLQMPDEPVETVFDARMMSQAMINVIKNAVEAIEMVEPVEGKEHKGRIVVRMQSSEGKVTIDFIDNGRGLPEANRQRLLEPYMTTREKGTGLGLAIVRKILEDHGGMIELMDSPEVEKGGRGALMRFALPVRTTVSGGGAAGEKEKGPEETAESSGKG